MGSHKPKVVVLDKGYVARCNCRWSSPNVRLRWEADDHITKHLELVERAKAHLKGSASLKVSRDHYRKMAEDETQTDHDRALWRQLAEELDRRLNEAGAHPDHQPELPLFDQ